MGLADRPRDDKPTCDQCDKHPSVRCPGCPKGPSRYEDKGMAAMIERDPELGRIVLRNAKAAKALAACPENHPAYRQLNNEYIEAGVALAAIREARR